jgi:hypothetical protein
MSSKSHILYRGVKTFYPYFPKFFSSFGGVRYNTPAYDAVEHVYVLRKSERGRPYFS